jgi:hypothetical protein
VVFFAAAIDFTPCSTINAAVTSTVPAKERITPARLESRSVMWSSVMRSSGWTPSIVPSGDDDTVYLVKDDLGHLGAVWREAEAETADLETVINDLLTGQYKDPIRVIAFNTAERWSQDVSEDVAHELRRRCDLQLRDVPSGIQDFVERHEGYGRHQLTLRLV